MAEYYPLLERAVSGLTDPSPDARRSIYERARNALLGQLRAMRPAIPEADIQRESDALDEAIARVESKFAVPPPRPAARPPAAARPATTVRPASAPGLPTATPPAVASPLPTVPPTVPPPIRERPTFAPRASQAAARSSAMPAGPSPTPTADPGPPLRASPVSRPPGPALTTGAAPNSAVTKPDEARPPNVVAAAAPAVSPVAAVLPLAPTLAMPAVEAARIDGASRSDGDMAPARPAPDTAVSGPSVGSRPREEGVRPAAPRRASGPPRRTGLWAGAALALVVAGGIGVAAWKLRDRPEQVTAAKHAPTAAEAPGKIAGRADESRADGPADTGAGAAVPPPVGQNDAPSTPQGAAPPEGAAAGSPAAGAPADIPAIPVAQRAALLIDAPDEPQKVKTYVGSVVWRTESVNAGQGQPLTTAVRADVEIPDAKLKLAMVLQKNPDPALPASHTIDLQFRPQPGNTLGGVKQINVPEMRKDDDPTGIPLTGVPVAITDNHFLVGLSRGPAEAQNLAAVRDRNWFDVSVLLLSGKVGKVTFEKGATGLNIIDNAAKSWQ